MMRAQITGVRSWGGSSSITSINGNGIGRIPGT